MQRSGQADQVMRLELAQLAQLDIGHSSRQPPMAPDLANHRGHHSRSNGSRAIASANMTGRLSLSRSSNARQAASSEGGRP